MEKPISFEPSNKEAYIPALGYHWLTNYYDTVVKLAIPENKIRNLLIDKLSIREDEKVLEFGCGTASNLILASKKHALACFYGLDIDDKILKLAQNKIQSTDNIQLHLYKGLNFPYGENTFDKIFTSFVFHLLTKETKINTLHQMRRVLKPGGKIIIADWGKAKNDFMRIAFGVVQLFDKWGTSKENAKGLIPVYMSDAGFKNVHESGYLNTRLGTFCFYEALK